MVRWLVVGICCAVFATNSLGQAEAPKEEQKQSVQGKVVDAKSGQPIRKVNIQVFGGAGQSYGRHEAITGADGTFTIEDMTPGRYNVTMQRAGFAQTPASRGQGTFTLASGQSLSGLVFRMQAAGVISGKIVDADGDPMAGVGVSVAPAGIQSPLARRFSLGAALERQTILGNTGLRICAQGNMWCQHNHRKGCRPDRFRTKESRKSTWSMQRRTFPERSIRARR